jgi:outer membrane immunogenic protein
VNASAAITQSIITFNFPAVGFNTTFTSGSSASVSETRVGWAAGLGLEHALAGNWTVKAEWLHWDLGSSTYGSTVSFSNVPLVAGGTVTTTSTAHFRGDIARAGVNYRFY